MDESVLKIFFCILRCRGIWKVNNRKTDENIACEWIRTRVSIDLVDLQLDNIYSYFISYYVCIVESLVEGLPYYSYKTRELLQFISFLRHTILLCFSERKQKIEDIKKNIRDAILVSN